MGRGRSVDHHPTGPPAQARRGHGRRVTGDAGSSRHRRPPGPRCSLSAVDALRTESLTKHYGRPRHGPLPGGPEIAALSDLTIHVNAGRDLRVPRPERRRQDARRSGSCSATSTRPPAGPRSWGSTARRRSVEIRARVGYLPGGIALYDGMTGLDLLDYLGQLYGRAPVRRAELRRPARAVGARPSAGRSATTRAGCARRSGSSRPSSTTPSWPSSTSRPRVSTRSCSAPSTTSSTTSGRPAGRSSSAPTSCPRSSGCATGWRSSGPADSSPSRTSTRSSPGGSATSSCGPPAACPTSAPCRG